ncbi:glycoside hydrolase family 13 protein [Desertivirga xinjiangensis]|uniref:glycoside hydrolase family 13 protein n=1 Tax=Desertivirga xinjiangensis TaxID=539206 RepID=UPI00210EC565|nr:alpha-glucosidase [Pedobacter xinjiangensis]
MNAAPINQRKWWKEAVVYQIYPRSFKDSNGDGIGDLNGIISKLDYIKNLGVDVVWLNPIFSSPNDDNGYDISDYKGIMSEFGTMEDFDALLQGMHDRGIRLILDLVVNHSSDEHRWFKEARSSRDNPYRNYYHWWPAEQGIPKKRFSFFDVNNDAWEYDNATNSYYLHYFSVKQPDLNWENPLLRKEIYDMMHFWFQKGIDGFRMDVIPFISKDITFPELPEEYHGNFVKYYAEGPFLHKYLHEMNREVLSRYDVMSVAEGIGVGTDKALEYVAPDRQELDMLYHFEGIGIGLLPYEFKAADPNGFSLIEFKDLYSKWDAVFAENGWGTIYLGNHDNPRILTRWGNDSPEYRNVSSKMLSAFLLTMRATPYYYAGDELGMSNIKFDSIDDYRDIETINMYRQMESRGEDLSRFLQNQKITARDNSRTPFQWDATENAGFSTGTPWLKVNPNYTTVNVAAQEEDPQSPLNFFRNLIQLRKKELALVYGRYVLLDRDNPHVYSYIRHWEDTTIIVMLNFSASEANAHLEGLELSAAKVLLSNYPDERKGMDTLTVLRAYEACICKLNSANFRNNGET